MYAQQPAAVRKSANIYNPNGMSFTIGGVPVVASVRALHPIAEVSIREPKA
jgi:hypothetical protein